MNLKETYNFIATDWHKDHQADNLWQEWIVPFCKLLPPDAHILDVGCAGGIKSKFLVDQGFKVLGIDFSEQFIEIANREVPDAEFEVLDMRDIEKVQGTFDGVLLLAVLLHLEPEEVPMLFSKLKEKLNENGIILLSVKEIREGQSETEIKEENDYGYSYKRFFSYFTQSKLESMLQNAGLKILQSSVDTRNQTSWIRIIAQKTT